MVASFAMILGLIGFAVSVPATEASFFSDEETFCTHRASLETQSDLTDIDNYSPGQLQLRALLREGQFLHPDGKTLTDREVGFRSGLALPEALKDVCGRYVKRGHIQLPQQEGLTYEAVLEGLGFEKVEVGQYKLANAPSYIFSTRGPDNRFTGGVLRTKFSGRPNVLNLSGRYTVPTVSVHIQVSMRELDEKLAHLVLEASREPSAVYFNVSALAIDKQDPFIPVEVVFTSVDEAIKYANRISPKLSHVRAMPFTYFNGKVGLAINREKPWAEEISELVSDSYVSNSNISVVFSKLEERGVDSRTFLPQASRESTKIVNAIPMHVFKSDLEKRKLLLEYAQVRADAFQVMADKLFHEAKSEAKKIADEKARVEALAIAKENEIAEEKARAMALEKAELKKKAVAKEISQGFLDIYKRTALRKGFELNFDLLNAHSFTFAKIKPGNFMMGEPTSERFIKFIGRESDASHSVAITKAFEVQKTHVTQLQWFLLMGTNPSNFKDKKYCPKDHLVLKGIPICPNHPVESISWNDAKLFIAELNKRNSVYNYSLLTEAQWEYAARAGTTTRYSFGDTSYFLVDTSTLDPSILELNQHVWHIDNSQKRTHRVGEKKPNPWGLFDMHGLVESWVEDLYAGIYQSTPRGSIKDPTGPTPTGSSSDARVSRGGSWANTADSARSASRNRSRPSEAFNYVGLRVARTIR